MPTYQYHCKQCGHNLEELQLITEPPLTRCPNCNTDSLVRIIGTGSGLIFKGSGFYLTDYKKGGSKSDREDSSKPETKSGNKDGSPSESSKPKAASSDTPSSPDKNK